MKLKSFKDFVEEDAPTTSVAAGGIDLAPAGRQSIMNKMDKRSKWDVIKLYKRSRKKINDQ